VAGRPVGWRLGRDRRPAGAGNCGERSAPAGMGGSLSVRSFLEGLGDPPSSGASREAAPALVHPRAASRPAMDPGTT
jgi:hypothetical protein